MSPDSGGRSPDDVLRFNTLASLSHPSSRIVLVVGLGFLALLFNWFRALATPVFFDSEANTQEVSIDS
jgi:hypothetical protein